MRNFAYFIALSLFVHFLLVYGMRFELPRRDADPLPLVARLQPAELPPPVMTRPARPARPAPSSKARTASRSVAATAAAATTPAFEPVADGNEAPPTPAQPPVAPVIEAPVAATPQPAPAAVPTPAPARRLPRKGVITYALYLGTEKFSVGETLQAWEINQDSYRLTSVSETTGLVSLFSRQRIAYESVGKFTASGLRPEFFASQRVRSGRSEEARASFDWNAMTIALGKVNEQKNAVLPADAQDLVSFMYQLGLRPLEPGRLELNITNGWKLERYELEVGTEEFLQTPFGTLRVLPVKQVRRTGRESIELWLATEYRLLPVRIRFFDRQGEPSGEQLVSDIRVSDD